MIKINQTNKGFAPNVQNSPIREGFATLHKTERKPIIISRPKQDLVE